MKYQLNNLYLIVMHLIKNDGHRFMLINCWLVGLFYDTSTLFRSFNTKLSHFDKSFKQFSLV